MVEGLWACTHPSVRVRLMTCKRHRVYARGVGIFLILLMPLPAMSETVNETTEAIKSVIADAPEVSLESGIKAAKANDFERARAIFSELASKDQVEAQTNLATLYFKGLGVPQDYAQAEKWYRKAASHGDAVAQAKLGLMAYYGLGMDKNADKAAEWFQQAAKQGEPGAQTILATLYAQGEGVMRNPVEAYFWYTLAIDSGNEAAISGRASVVDELTPGELDAVLQRIREWRQNEMARLKQQLGLPDKAPATVKVRKKGTKVKKKVKRMPQEQNPMPSDINAIPSVAPLVQ